MGNPPYIRPEDIPDSVLSSYRASYPTMVGRADLYVAFYEAALRQLEAGGACGFICADRWLLNQYGSELRRMVTAGYSVEAIVEMHEANAFEDDVSAYPAVTVIRRSQQGTAVVAVAQEGCEGRGGAALATAIRQAANGVEVQSAGLTLAVVKTWFSGTEPWPCTNPRRLALLRRIEDGFGVLETPGGSTRVGIGVATGLDGVFVTTDRSCVEDSRLLPLAMAGDTAGGRLRWSGHYLVNPWDKDGLVNLDEYPELRSYFQHHEAALKARHTSQKHPVGWYRTIDRVAHELLDKPKLYIPDIKDEFNPVLDPGGTYPHHNLYYIQSERWDLEVLGGLLLSSVAQFFVASYGVRMRGGYLRFQAQYLRRVRVPSPDAIPEEQQERLRHAFRTRDRNLATAVALKIYNIGPEELAT